MKNDKTHPAYGMLSITRTSGSKRKLFGSAVRDHQHTFRIELRTGTMYNSGHGNYYMAADRVPLFEVEVSPAQFVELISSHNIGDGIPCTIRHSNGKDIELIPEEDTTEQEDIIKEHKQTVLQASAGLREFQAELDVLLAKPKLSKADKERIRDTFFKATKSIRDMAPYLLSIFEEATQKVVTEAKVTADSALTQMLGALGLGALKNKLLLPGKDK